MESSVSIILSVIALANRRFLSTSRRFNYTMVALNIRRGALIKRRKALSTRREAATNCLEYIFSQPSLN